ncbi:acyltransferase domain-containing protein [Phaeobacter inhibens]|uniref:type I polyketide synthase n=1 Tax=Phaeobacter inhibens TaxID=221822 RepID=UPI0021A453EF|nr:type I polyketide synthase [Phaeobacter inhibens]UWR84963.1 acyltransferase domain-containing protein [Phaeobacter inhibens]
MKTSGKTTDRTPFDASRYSGDIAIVGMSLCVPGAQSPGVFWQNLRDGVGSIRPVSEDDLLAAGEDPETLSDPNYVAATAALEGYAEFDADFFGFSPKEAAILDPQHRKFLEVAWSAMEDAGHPPESLDGPIGVYAGCGMGSYFYFNICSNKPLVDDVGMFLLRHTGNDKDFLSTRVSHVFDLKGPSVNIQTACSTSLVAVHYASKALREGECEMAIAGGVTIELPQGRGYLFKENEILSPDGHCHAFDHRAQGTVFGSGAGAVALRRLEDALADGDHIWAVIKGSAINNDGADKAGYLAPSVEGQASAVRQALRAAKTPPDTIDYVECHGTGTYLGDPIEVTALTEAYRETTPAVGYCRIGSVKTNIGHLDTAAGVAGLIKTTLALHHGQIPPSLGYEAPNPAIDFETSPFVVNDHLRDWTSAKGPRRAAINALGVGGTNAHAVLEQAAPRPASDESDFPFHVLCLSGHSKAALDANATALAAHLRANPDLPLADVAYTLKEGRRGFAKRRTLVAETPEEAATLLEAGDPRRVFDHTCAESTPEVVFMFPGGGAQYAGMARDLYETEPVFADWMDRGLDHLESQLDYDIRALWLPDPGQEGAANVRLQQPSVQLPLIMIVEFALAQLWLSWGVRPAALVGHSMGENTAACLAGVLSFEDCIDLVLLRGRLFDKVPAGGMLSISLPLEEVEARLPPELDIASVNASRLTAVSGPQETLDALAAQLTADEVDHQRIQIDIAAHSRMLEGILEEYRQFLRGLTLTAPGRPILSNRSGRILSDAEATDPEYWVGQLRNTVMFSACLDTLAEQPNRLYLEVGPGKALSSLAQMAPAIKPGQVLSSLRHPDQTMADDAYFFGVIGRLWAAGLEADWDQIWGDARRQRLPLPTYAFQRSRYFIEPAAPTTAETAISAPLRHDDLSQWGSRPSWRPALASCDLDVTTELDQQPETWLLFEDDTGLCADLAPRLEQAGHRVVRVAPGDTYAQLSESRYMLAPEQGRAGYDALLADLTLADLLPSRIGHFWLVTEGESFRPGASFSDRNLEMGFYALTALGQALAQIDLPQPLHMTVFTTGAAQLRNEPLPYPEKAMIAGPAGVLPREIPGLTCATVDIELPTRPNGLRRWLSEDAPVPITDRLLEEVLADPANDTALWRGDKRYALRWRPVALPDSEQAPSSNPAFREGGTYLITGGYGGIGRTIAADLMQSYGANVVLVSRGGLPPRDNWESYLNRHSPANITAQRIRAVMALDAIGRGRVLPLAADVCNSEQMRAAVATAEETFGPITGVIHGAGQINDAPVLAKTEDDIAQVLAPKVSGLRVLDAIFGTSQLELMVLFASSSTVTRPIGQVDYVAANEYLNAFAKHCTALSSPDQSTHVVAVDWGVWADVGMAADALGSHQPEAGSDPSPCDQPLLDSRQFAHDGSLLFHRRLTNDQWILDEHRTKNGTPLIPGTGYIEYAAEALAELGHDAPFALRDLYFLRPLVVTGAPCDMTVRLTPVERGYDFAVYSRTAEGYALHVQALLETDTDGGTPAPVDIAELRLRMPEISVTTPAERLKTPQEAHLKFGPRWHVLEETRHGAAEGLAQLKLPQIAEKDGTLLPPGLLDLATGWAIDLAPAYRGTALWVPVSYDSIQIFAPLPVELLSHMRLVDSTASSARFDITLAAADGAVVAEIRGFQMQHLPGATNLAPAEGADASAEDLGLIAPGSAQPLSPEERRLHRNIAQGIRAEDGPEALRRALATGLSQVVVSSLALPDLIAQADQPPPQNADTSQSFERPQLDTDYLAPRNTVEEEIAAQFARLLGVAQVGVEDSFFDLGGHSLIAVRLFAQIKRSFGVDLAISTLFEAPSVAKLAELVIARTGGGLTTEAPVDAAGDTPTEAPSYTHLVQLHPGDGTGRRPFFLVAGMFGNVLNLRHLALMVGKDRPVYGLQARGLIGEDAPHDRLDEAARDYLVEIRSVQPDGPYLLGGFSGGGLTAYEMAQQLQAEGEETAALILLDTPLPLRPELSRRDKALIKWAELRSKGIGYLGEWISNRIAWEIEKRRYAASGDSAAPVFNNRKVELAFRAALPAYDLQPWSGPLTLFRPPLDRHWQVSAGNWVSREREYVFDDNDWTRWAPAVEVVEVPGDHDSMVLVPNVSVLAGEVKARLDAADAAALARSTAEAAE